MTVAMSMGEALAVEREAMTVEALVGAHARLVFKIAYSVLRHADDAEDAVQDTFMRVLRHERELATVDDPKAWLARIAWRVACDKAKSRRRNEGDALTDVAAASVLEQSVIGEQQVALVHALIEKLPSDLRDVVKLSTVDEMTSAEVAAVLGIPEGSVRTRMMRAREVLKQKVAAMLRPRAGQ